MRVLDAEARELGPGETGRIFVGSDMTFDGYTNGATKETRSALMSTGDMGHMDAAGGSSSMRARTT